jgi:hypothetical protein
MTTETRQPPTPQDKRRGAGWWNGRDAEDYARVLAPLNQFLKAARTVLAEHDDDGCSGCDLCWDCEGILYSVELFESCLRGYAPPDSWPDRDELRAEVLRDARAQAQADAPAIAEPAELPTAHGKPYWVA